MIYLPLPAPQCKHRWCLRPSFAFSVLCRKHTTETATKATAWLNEHYPTSDKDRDGD